MTLFTPGKSGNSGGRPIGSVGIQRLAKSASVDAVNALSQISNDVSAPAEARVEAAQTILNVAGIGRPSQELKT